MSLKARELLKTENIENINMNHFKQNDGYIGLKIIKRSWQEGCITN